MPRGGGPIRGRVDHGDPLREGAKLAYRTAGAGVWGSEDEASFQTLVDWYEYNSFVPECICASRPCGLSRSTGAHGGRHHGAGTSCV
eukprot:5337085-Pyramimonas_sp.AAC.2